jgi:Big-like domain-containing protein/carboxypeptidase family protein
MRASTVMRFRTVVFGLILATGVVVAPVSAYPAPAAAGVGNIDVELPVGSRITGTITDGAGPVAGGSISACAESTGQCGDATTAADGTYTVVGLDADLYVLQVDPPEASDLLFAYYSSNGPESDFEAATRIDTTGGDVTGVDLALEAGFRIEGVVRDPLGRPIAGIDVAASGHGSSGVGTTDATGAYAIRALRPGSYQLQVRTGGRSNYVGGPYVDGAIGDPSEDGTPVDVDGNVTGIDILVQPGLRISGTLAGITSSATTPVTITADGDPFGYAVSVAPDGTWMVAGLRPGQYKPFFAIDAGGFGTFLGYWRSDGTLTLDYDAATFVDVVGADVGGLDATVAPAPSVSGRIVSDGGSPLSNAFVLLCSDSVGCVSGTTDGAGTFRLDRIPSGDWRLFAGARDHVSGYLGPDGFTLDQADATVIRVGTRSVSSLEVTLPDGFEISGRVSGPDGEPVVDAQVARSGGVDQGGAGVDRTDENGEFRIGGVTPGSYTVFILAPERTGYVSGYFSSGAPGNFSSRNLGATDVTIDAVGPVVVATTPAPGTSGVSRDAEVVITFDRYVVGLDARSVVLSDGTHDVKATLRFDRATRTLALDPRSRLRPGHRYQVRLAGSIRDLLGMGLEPSSWTFTTR